MERLGGTLAGQLRRAGEPPRVYWEWETSPRWKEDIAAIIATPIFTKIGERLGGAMQAEPKESHSREGMLDPRLYKGGQPQKNLRKTTFKVAEKEIKEKGLEEDLV